MAPTKRAPAPGDAYPPGSNQKLLAFAPCRHLVNRAAGPVRPEHLGIGGDSLGHAANGVFSAVACLAIVFSFSGVMATGAFASAANAGVHEGVATCGGSACHGRLVKRDHGVWLNEIHLWQDPTSPAGAHSRASEVLGGERAAAIARRLGLESAETASICLGCHTDPAEARGPKFQESDGVGCEACHGGSKSWVPTHYVLNIPHATNVRNGMVALEKPDTRAEICLDCHFGSAAKNQFVSHAMMAAGHPRISFELDLFSDLQAHYSEDADYLRRMNLEADNKSDASIVIEGYKARTWAVGQSKALERALTLYSGAHGGGVFPEFYFFDCYSCHRAVSSEPEAQPKALPNPARPIPTGAPPFNDAHMIMLSAAARVIAPGIADRFDEQCRAFQLALTQSRENAIMEAAALAQTARELAAAFDAASFGKKQIFAILDALMSDNLSARYTDYSGSEQAVMAIDTLRNALVVSGAVARSDAMAMQPDIELLYQATHDPNDYRPVEFRAVLQRVAASIRRLQP